MQMKPLAVRCWRDEGIRYRQIESVGQVRCVFHWARRDPEVSEAGFNGEVPVESKAKNEVKDLQSLIDKEGGNFKLQPWDWWYYAEKVKKEKYALDESMLRPYFELENVRNGAFEVATRLWGITFKELQHVPVYHSWAPARPGLYWLIWKTCGWKRSPRTSPVPKIEILTGAARPVILLKIFTSFRRFSIL